MYKAELAKQSKKYGPQPHLRKQALVYACPVCKGHVLSLESRSTPAPLPIPVDLVPRGTVMYREAICTSMHLCSLAIDVAIYTSNAWLCDNAMDLAIHHFNREQGPDGRVLFISSLFLHHRVNVAPTTLIDGRQPQACSTLVKCINFGGNHWIAAVWSRHQPDTVFILDSLAPDTRASTKRNRITMYNDAAQHFVQFCEQLDGTERDSINLDLVQTAQQDDGTSCGLFVIEFARLLASPAADITGSSTRRQLEQVSVAHTRQWLKMLSNTLGNAPAPYARSVAAALSSD